MNNQIFLAYDGDNAGRLVGRAILADDAGALSEISARINLGHEVVKKWVQEHNGQVISGGGDEGCFSLPAEAVENIEELRRDYEFSTNLTMSVGVGQNLSQAGKSLMVAKFRGKNQVVMYDQTVESDIQATQDRVAQGQGSEEEQKLGEAYLSPGKEDQQFQQDSWQTDQIKKEKTGQPPAQLATESPEQKQEREASEQSATTSAKTSAENPDENAQAGAVTTESPQEASAKTTQEAASKAVEGKVDARPGDAKAEERQLPDKTVSKQQEEEIGQANKHVIGKEMSTPREKAEATGNDPSKDEFKAPVKKGEPQESVDMATEKKPEKDVKNEKGKEAPKEAPPQGKEAAPQGQEEHSEVCPSCGQAKAQASEVVQEAVDNPPADAATQQQQLNAVDNTQMPVSTEMEGNVSRPDGFKEQNVPGDVGMDGGPEGGVTVENGNPEDTQDNGLGGQSPADQENDAAMQQQQAQEQQAGEPGAEEIEGVMQDGLDAGQDQEQEEKVKQMIGQALEGFKNNKQALEQASAQAPELYTSCVSMLLAMIEMAKMLGLSDGSEEIPGQEQGQEQPCPTCGKGGQEQPGQEQQAGEGGFPPEKDGKEGGFPPKKDGKDAKPGEKEKPEGKEKTEGKGGFPPKKDDKSAAPKEGAANEPPKGSKPGAGSGAGKLPTSATTKHVARTPLQEGSINLKGQQKTTDKVTGKTRWIDRKKGVVMGPSGVPVKEGSKENKK